MPPAKPAPPLAPAVAAASAADTLRVSAVPDEALAKPVPGGDSRPVLAFLEVINEGFERGKRFEIRVPLAHIGRGAHNDVVIDDDSVSDTHAKLQRREDGWYLIDLGSTNGTYVGGSRLTTNERRLDGAPDVRFGGVKLTFRPADIPVPAAKSTRAIAATPIDRTRLPPREQRPSAPPKQPVPAAPATEEKSGTSAWTWVAILIAAAVVAFYLLKS